jgi:hypothetical protein
MNQKKKQKVYLAVLGLAVVAFVLDRTMFDASTTEPAAATAALRKRETKKVSKPKSVDGDRPVQQIPAAGSQEKRQSIGRRILLCCSASSRECPDAFTPSQLWVAREVEDQQEAPEVQDRTTLESLKSRHSLTAVLSGRQGMAILGGRCVRVGQTIEGCKLIEVTGQTAVFQAGSHRIEMKVPQ